ncbi:gag-pol polyprotein [Tanacetum coccineum]
MGRDGWKRYSKSSSRTSRWNLSCIEEKKTSIDIWEHLDRLYEASSLYNKNFLKRKLYALRMTESTLVTEHVNNLNTLFCQLTSFSCKIEPQERTEILLQSLPDSCDQVIINLTSNVLADYLVFDDVATVILEEENRRNNREDRQTSSRQVEALVVTRGRSMEPGFSGSLNHSKSKTGRKKNFKCYKCGKPGHFKKDCRGLNTSYPQRNFASTSKDGQLDDSGRKVEIQNKIMKIIKGVLVLMRREKVNANLYQLKRKIIEEVEASVDSHSPSHRVTVTWHHKLGHMSEQGMNILMERKLLPSLTKVSLPFCEHYVISKQHCLKFKTLNSRSVSVLELVHSNVWQAPVSPWEEQSILYPSLITIPRDVGCTQSRKSLRCLKFSKFTQRGNQRQFTMTYTPQQNGVAERINRTLLERARAMLATTSLGKSFWVEAINTECYVINHSPSTVVKLKTPMEMWTRKPVNYSDLHIYGSPVYVMYNMQETTVTPPKSGRSGKKSLVLKAQVAALEERTVLFILCGSIICSEQKMPDISFGMIVDEEVPIAHKVVASRDVVFMEDKIQENEEGDITTRETTLIQMEKKFQSNDSFEVAPKHEVNKTNESQALATRTLYHERKRPRWHSDYVIESNITYCLLTEEREPSTLQKALNNPNASFWKEAMQEEIKALHKNKT